MSQGRRYTEEEQEEILRYQRTHTYLETSEKYGVSQMTLARWARRSKMSILNYTGIEAPQDLATILQSLKFLEGIKVISVISSIGQTVASIGLEKASETTIAAITAAILSLGDRASGMVGQGKLEMVCMKSSEGTIIVIGAGETAVLVLLFDGSADVGNIFTKELPLINRVRSAIEAVGPFS